MKDKCYIAGKVGELPIEEYTANFEKAKQEVIDLGYEPVSPVDLLHNHDKTWESYMREDLPEMLKCQAIYVLKNYQSSNGSKIEFRLAVDLNYKIILQK